MSIASATEVVAALRSRGQELILVDTARGSVEGAQESLALTANVPEVPPSQASSQRMRDSSPAVAIATAVESADVVLFALHGGSGENGQFQALLELAGVVFTGSGSFGSGLAMDKNVSERLFRAAGIPTPDWTVGAVSGGESASRLGYLLIVKPNAQGSTIGLSLVRSSEELDAAMSVASPYGEILFEQFIRGRELTVGVLAGESLAVGEMLLVTSRGVVLFSAAERRVVDVVSHRAMVSENRSQNSLKDTTHDGSRPVCPARTSRSTEAHRRHRPDPFRNRDAITRADRGGSDRVHRSRSVRTLE